MAIDASKLLGVLFACSLLALPLAACESAPWEGGVTLILKVDTPRNGTTVNTPSVTVSGHLVGTRSAAAKVRINDASVPVNAGKFSATVPLMERTNVIEIVASSSGGATSQEVTVTYVPCFRFSDGYLTEDRDPAEDSVKP